MRRGAAGGSSEQEGLRAGRPAGMSDQRIDRDSLEKMPEVEVQSGPLATPSNIKSNDKGVHEKP